MGAANGGGGWDEAVAGASAELIDALPYIDPLDGAEKEQADELIKQEMRRMDATLADYEASLPPMPESRLKDHPLLLAELQRIEEGREMEKLDMSRYGMAAPDAGDAPAWQAAVDNAGAQAQHQAVRVMNLELQAKFGGKVWGGLNRVLDSAVAGLEHRLQDTRARTEAVNRARKELHEAAGRELSAVQRQLREAQAEEASVRSAMAELEREVAAMRGQAAGGEAGGEAPPASHPEG